MTITEIDRIKVALTAGKATEEDFYIALDEAMKFHHKVSRLQESLILIKKQCQMEMQDLEAGKPVTRMHIDMLLDYIVHSVEESQHIKAA